MFRVLLRLRKGHQVKYLSHLDMIRAFGFALRRAKTPVAYSAGFNPRPKMSFGSAIGVGVTSDDERILLELSRPEPASHIEERLNACLPGGIEVLSAEDVPEGVKSPLSALNASEYRLSLVCAGSCDASAVEKAVGDLLAASEIKVIREREGKTREMNIRPGLLGAQVSAEGDTVSVDVSLKTGESGGGRPQDFAQALMERIPGSCVRDIHRIRQFHAE